MTRVNRAILPTCRDCKGTGWRDIPCCGEYGTGSGQHGDECGGRVFPPEQELCEPCGAYGQRELTPEEVEHDRRISRETMRRIEASFAKLLGYK